MCLVPEKNIKKNFRNKFVGSLVITFRFSSGDTDRKVSGKGVAQKYSGIFFSEMNRISQKMIDVEPGMEFFGGSKSFGMSGLPTTSLTTTISIAVGTTIITASQTPTVQLRLQILPLVGIQAHLQL